MSTQTSRSSPASARSIRVRVRRRARRVAGERDQRPHLALAGRLHLLRERGGRAARRATRAGRGRGCRRPSELRRAAAPRRAGRSCAARRRRAVNIAPPGPVEVAGQDVEHVDEPRGERPERLRRRPDPAVDGGRLGRGELARHPADRRRAAMPVTGATASGVNGCAELLAPPRSRRSARRAGRARPGPPRRGRGRARTADARRCRDGSDGARRRPRRCGCGAGRRRRACRRAPGAP